MDDACTAWARACDYERGVLHILCLFYVAGDFLVPPHVRTVSFGARTTDAIGCRQMIIPPKYAKQPGGRGVHMTLSTFATIVHMRGSRSR